MAAGRAAAIRSFPVRAAGVDRVRKRLVPLMVVVGLVGARFAFAADSPVGMWKTIDDKTGEVESEIELYEQGGKLFGKIASMPEPDGKDGKPKVCGKCPGADAGRPILGLVIIKGLSPGGDRYKDGTVLDPKDGKVYKAEVWVEDGKLKVRGYLGMFYRTQTWLKAN
jgi:uncharacterized protein (DUF2147 family)